MNAIARFDDYAEAIPLPNAIEAEQAVLGMLMLAPESLAKVSDWLGEGDFFRDDHRLIYRAIVGLICRAAPVDPVTLGEWFQSNGLADRLDSIAYLIELSNGTASIANLVAHAEIVVEKSRLRAAIDIARNVTQSAMQPGADSQAIIGDTLHTLSVMQASKVHGGLEPAKDAIAKAWTDIQARYNAGPGLLGQPWPWKGLNDCTKGLRDGVLYIVGARPSMGKSIFGLQTAVFSAIRGNRTAFFSVEMGAGECMARAMACVGEIPHEWVEHPDDKHDDAQIFWPRLSRAMQTIKDSDLLIDETPAISGRQMIARARRAHMQKPLRLIIVDHMHDMEVDPKQARFDYGVITQLGKTMAKEFRCPVILLAQLNRAAANRAEKRPTMTDLRESGEIEQKGDVILFLHREDYYKKGEMEGVVEVIPAKGRNIRTGSTIYLQNTFSEMRMQDWIGPLPMPTDNAMTPHRGRGIGARKAA
ncbi:DnaB-like helicase C-terminal domain-containing protein [Dyella sp.]|uniref:replicative DNA helicase n=1 Tax=Dyella sp. TaxID=1869338 RepID=UPI00284DFB31|nr:DnaB-like helicase C-terminal domain-containing protein [Dyella sp.]MDR3445968.1 DnaB-like helicase C-terminal domain-containing protein [Dyella sp.]